MERKELWIARTSWNARTLRIKYTSDRQGQLRDRCELNEIDAGSKVDGQIVFWEDLEDDRFYGVTI